MAFLVKRQGLSTRDLIDYYEGHHVPLIASLAPVPATYKRNFLLRDDGIDPQDDFDVVTEITFPDQAAYDVWVSTMYAPESGVVADEMKFLDRSRARSYVVEERVTSSRGPAPAIVYGPDVQ
jgi:EthD domain